MNRSGFISVPGGRVFFETRGRFSPQKAPVLLLHGGPGFSHELQLGIEAADPERGWVFYTQLGSGRSDRPQDPIRALLECRALEG